MKKSLLLLLAVSLNSMQSAYSQELWSNLGAGSGGSNACAPGETLVRFRKKSADIEGPANTITLRCIKCFSSTDRTGIGIDRQGKCASNAVGVLTNTGAPFVFTGGMVPISYWESTIGQ